MGPSGSSSFTKVPSLFLARCKSSLSGMCFSANCMREARVGKLGGSLKSSGYESSHTDITVLVVLKGHNKTWQYWMDVAMRWWINLSFFLASYWVLYSDWLLWWACIAMEEKSFMYDGKPWFEWSVWNLQGLGAYLTFHWCNNLLLMSLLEVLLHFPVLAHWPISAITHTTFSTI